MMRRNRRVNIILYTKDYTGRRSVVEKCKMLSDYTHSIKKADKILYKYCTENCHLQEFSGKLE